MREAHQHHGNPAETRYGKKKWGGREIDFAEEQRVVKAVLEMKESNMGLRQIARVMTQMGIPTKTRGGAWHPEMIRRIVNKYGD